MTDERLSDESTALFKSYSYVDELGCNVVKLQLQPWDFQTGAPILFGMPLRDRLLGDLMKWEKLIAWCLSRQIHVQIEIMNFITWPISRVWPDDGRSIWKNATAQDELVDAIGALALKYRGVPGIILSPLTEPHGVSDDEVDGDHGLPRTVWDVLSQRMLGRVRGIDATRWLVIEPIWSMPQYFKYLSPSNDSRVMYGYHIYAPHEFTYQTTQEWSNSRNVLYPGPSRDYSADVVATWDKNRMAAYIEPAAAFGIAHGVRVQVGEFGCLRTAPAQSRARWTGDIAELLEQHGHDWVFFRYEGWGASSSFREGWAVEQSEVESVLRPYYLRNS